MTSTAPRVGDVCVLVKEGYNRFVRALDDELAALAPRLDAALPEVCTCRIVGAEAISAAAASSAQVYALQAWILQLQLERMRSDDEGERQLDVRTLWAPSSDQGEFLVPACWHSKQKCWTVGDAVKAWFDAPGGDGGGAYWRGRVKGVDQTPGDWESVFVAWDKGGQQRLSPWELEEATKGAGGTGPAPNKPRLACGCPGTFLTTRDRDFLCESVKVACARLSREQMQAPTSLSTLGAPSSKTALARPPAVAPRLPQPPARGSSSNDEDEEDDALTIGSLHDRIAQSRYRSIEHLLYEARAAFEAAVLAAAPGPSARKTDPATDPFLAFSSAVQIVRSTAAVRRALLCQCEQAAAAAPAGTQARADDQPPGPGGGGGQAESGGESEYEGSGSEASSQSTGGAGPAAPEGGQADVPRRPRKRQRTEAPASGAAAGEGEDGGGDVYAGELALQVPLPAALPPPDQRQADAPSVEAAAARGGAALRVDEGGPAGSRLLLSAGGGDGAGPHEPLAVVRLGRPARRPAPARKRKSAGAGAAGRAEEAGPDAAVWGALVRLAHGGQIALELALGEAVAVEGAEGAAAVRATVRLRPVAFGRGPPEGDEAEHADMRLLLAALASQRARGHAHVGAAGQAHGHHAHLASFDLYALYEAVRPPREAPEAEQPAGLLPALHPFQRKALAWMLARERAALAADAGRAPPAGDPHPLFEPLALPAPPGGGEGATVYRNLFTGRIARRPPPPPPPPRGGLLCEEMGLGKTVELIALVLAHPRPAGRGGTLVVVPAHILTQWQHELRRHAPGLSVLVYEGVPAEMKKAERGRRRRKGPAEDGSGADAAFVSRFDVVLVTYATLRGEIWYTEEAAPSRRTRYGASDERRRTVTPLVGVRWWRLVLDEAQQVGSFNAAAQMADQVSAVFRWGATGTPVSGSLRDLGGLLRLVRSEPFQRPAWWRRLVDGYEERTPAGVGRLVAFLRTVLWRHLKAHVDDEIRLPACLREARVLKFSPVEYKLYKRVLTETQELVLQNVAAAPTSNKVANKLLQLRQLCVHPNAAKGGELLGHAAEALTLDGIMKRMKKRAQLERDIAGRELVRAHVALACVCVERAEELGAEEAWRRAAEALEEALRVADAAVAARVGHLQAKLDGLGPEAGGTLEAASRAAALAALYEMSARHEAAAEGYRRALAPAAAAIAASEGEARAEATARAEAEARAEAKARADAEARAKKRAEEGGAEEEEKERALTAGEVQAAIGRSNAEKTVAVLRAALGGRGPAVAALYAECDRLERRVLEERGGAALVQKAAAETKDFVIAQKYVHLAHRIEEMGWVPQALRVALEELLISRVMTLRGWAAAVAREGLAERAQALQADADATQEQVFALNPERRGKGAQYARSVVRIPSGAAPWLLLAGAVLGNLARVLSRPGAPPEAAGEAGELRERQAAIEGACGDGAVRLDGATSAWLACAFGALRGLLEVRERREEAVRAEALRARARLIREELPNEYKAEMEDAEQFWMGLRKERKTVEAAERAVRAAQEEAGEAAQLQEFLGRNLEHILRNGAGHVCPVCRLDITKEMEPTLTPCAHIFCHQCITELFLHGRAAGSPACICPVCRRRCYYRDLLLIDETAGQEGAGQEAAAAAPSAPPPSSSSAGAAGASGPSGQQSEHGTKIGALCSELLALRREDPRLKCLVFSQWPPVLQLARRALEAAGVGCGELKGTVAQRARALERFEEPDSGVSCLLLSMKASSSGLTLVAATRVYVLEPHLNWCNTEQAINRIHRIGQQRQTTVVRLLVNNTVEMNIMRLQAAQRQGAPEGLAALRREEREQLKADELLSILDIAPAAPAAEPQPGPSHAPAPAADTRPGPSHAPAPG